MVEVLRFAAMVNVVHVLQQPQASERKRSMQHYIGLDVSVKETAVCIVDETDKICREVKVPSHPDDLIAVLKDPSWQIERVGLEAGPLSQWLFEDLARGGLPVICIETRHVKAFMKAQPNKTDRNDARGIAQMMRVNLYRPVHVKTLTSQKRRALLTARKLLQGKAIAIENDIRGLLRNFGLKVGNVGAVKFEERICELVDGMADLQEIMEPLLTVRRKLRFARLDKKVLDIARNDEMCQLLMTVPDIGCRCSPGIHEHHRHSTAVQELEGCRLLGLTPKLNESGESKRVGRVSLCGDAMMRALLYEAAQTLLNNVKKWSWLKAWAMNVAKRSGKKNATVALSRRLAVIMHRIMSDGTEFCWTRDALPAAG
ncbi:IS110 family transposase [Mesorhizobium sp. M0800]|uniref:IS110 family transposase n=1 Tax=Mesorhizobium sp. M0800 TaxID=2957000 RepID=UPI00333CB8CC